MHPIQNSITMYTHSFRSIDNFILSNLELNKNESVIAKNCIMCCLLEQWELKTKDKNLCNKVERVYINEVI